MTKIVEILPEAPGAVGRQRGRSHRQEPRVFFGDIETPRITQGVLRTARVMTGPERIGQFSAAIKDPVTGLPFGDNRIPTNGSIRWRARLSTCCPT